ncbi:MAG: hypothetical protein WC947_08145 [Elusimicrobiota bacterium]
MADFNKDMSIEEILEGIKKSDSGVASIPTGTSFLQYKLHQELLKEQREFQQKHLKSSARLVYATWALAGFTLILSIVTFVAK